MRRILLTACTVMLTSHAAFSGEPLQRPRQAGVINYRLKAGTTAAQKMSLATLLGACDKGAKKNLDALKLHCRQFELNGKTEEQMCTALRETGAVEFAEPDYGCLPDATPNDPGYSSQWFHTKIKSAAAWDVTTGSNTIIVAVCDSGVLSTHPDLAPNIKLPGFNSVDNSSNSEPITSHGTAVAGCIAAVGNNGQGGAGVAWNVKILPVRISNASDGYAYFSDMAEGIRWAADRGAKVANLSYHAGMSATIDSAAQYLRGKGGLLFVCAGNNSADITATYPDFASFVLVGATTSSDTRASWSNYGPAVDIAAPGVGIYTTSSSGGYASMSGTSFSTPISAGIAALIYSLKPSLTPAEVESIIFSTCVDIGTVGEDNNFGKGLVDAAAAVNKAKTFGTNVAPTAVISASPTNGTAPLAVSFSGSGSTDSDGTISAYAWNFGDGSTGTGATLTHTYNSAGSYAATLTVTDNGNATGTRAVTITVTAANRAPVAANQSLSTAEDTAKALVLTASDADGNPLTYSVVGLPTKGVLSGTAPNLIYRPNANYSGSDSFTFKANDGTSDSNLATISISVTAANDAPVANNQSVTTAEDTLRLITLSGSDVDGSPLSYSLVSNPTRGTLSGTIPNLSYRPAANLNGADSFTFRISDGTLFSNTATVSIAISAVNDAPVAQSRTLSTLKNLALPVTLVATDVENSVLSYTVVAPPLNGTLSGTAPNLTYTPALNYVGPDSFTFKARDAALDSNVATVTLNVQQNSLIVHWKFDESSGTLANDASGNNNHGTLRSGATWTSGQLGGGIALDGTTSGAVLKNPVSSFPSTAITAAFWMKSSDTAKAGTPISYAVAGSDNNFLIYNYSHFSVYVAGSLVATPVRANDGLWHHIAVTWQSSNGQVLVYRDGVQLYAGTLRAGATLGTGGALVVGQEQDAVAGGFSASQAYKGSLDDVRIYSSVLSPNEIGSLAGGAMGGEIAPAEAPSALSALSTVAANEPLWLHYTPAVSEGTGFTWDFGDGTGDSSGSAAVAHAFSSGGTYTITLTLTDAEGELTTLTHTVTVTTVDDQTGNAAKPQPGALLSIVKASGTLWLNSTGRDKCTLSGTLDLPPGFSCAGASAVLSLNNVRVEFVLDAKGRAKNAAGACTLNTRSASFKFTLRNGSFAQAWNLAGVNVESADNLPLNVALSLNSVGFSGATQAQAIIQPGRSCVFRMP